MSLLRCQAEWEELDKEFKQLQLFAAEQHLICPVFIYDESIQMVTHSMWMLRNSKTIGYQRKVETHKVYRQKLDELSNLQVICSNSISKQKRRIKDLACSLRRYKYSANVEEAEVIQKFNNDIKERRNVFFEMEAFLPKKNGLYLNLVLGNVNVTLLSKQAKFAYKDEYEKFKLYLTIILLLGTFHFLAGGTKQLIHKLRSLLATHLNATAYGNWVIDEIFNFLLVWYYCTLTIRESVLISNGSRIKGWWVSHHYVSTFLSGVMLTWPNGLMYQMFRSQFLAFSIYQSCVQFLQYYYQSGCLYRLRALGERDHMDLTVEGFQSWMWRGLTFLLPFLFFGHFWQLYNSVTLFGLSQHERCKEWQVFVLALTFLVLFLGNFLTTLKVVHQKFQKNKDKLKKL
ncbi:transmembrane protein 120B isoform X2 [Stegostoma tigrinum]|uniref:transmembrane protein 120B isoform X2 n=1 Tax=Stegostoma tigrinum TaxID=3053191 RepID=UPI00202B7C4C|nr:transmembrane protein 120B isoform X2 [Stegostoma tigrinum]